MRKRKNLQHPVRRSRKLPIIRNKKKTSPPAITTEVRLARKLVLDPIVSKLFDQKIKSKNHRLDKNVILNTFKSYKSTLEWLTLDMIKCKLRRKYAKYKENVKKTIATTEIPSIAPLPPPPGANPSDTSRNKGGRPKGTTIEKTVHLQKCTNAAKNEIALVYSDHVQKRKAEGKRVHPKTLLALLSF